MRDMVGVGLGVLRGGARTVEAGDIPSVSSPSSKVPGKHQDIKS